MNNTFYTSYEEKLPPHDPRIPDRIIRIDPKARISNGSELKVENIMFIIFCIVIMTIGSVFFIRSYFEGLETKDFFAKAEMTTGTVVSGWSHTVGSVKNSRKHYFIGFAYEYQGVSFENTEQVSRSFANKYGVGSHCKGKSITVYFDPMDPSESRIEKVDGEPFYLYIILPGIVTVITMFLATKQYIEYRSGKYILYEDNGVWKKEKIK